MKSLRSKVLAAIIAITLLTACGITAAVYMRSAMMLEDNYGKTLYSRIEQMGKGFDDNLKEIYYTTVQAASDITLGEKVSSYEETKEAEKLYEIADMLRVYSDKNHQVQSMYLLLKDENTIISSLDYKTFQYHIPDQTVKQIVEAGGPSCTPVSIQDPLGSSGLLSFVDSLLDKNGRTVGYLMSNMAERDIYYQYLDGLEKEQPRDAVILTEEGRIISTKQTSRVGMHYQEEEGKSYLSTCYQTNFSGLQILVCVEKKEILSDLHTLRYFFLLFLAAFSLLSIGVAYLVTRALYRPIQKLRQTMEEVKEGDLEARVTPVSKDEIGVLSQDFNTMLDQVEELIDQVVKEKVLKKDAELEALQYQITPHFMYNTLNSIKYAAIMQGNQNLGELLGDFIELLQASINKKGTFITISDEIHILDNYVQLQLFRYENSFTMRYEVDKEAQGCFIPRLLLQPLVENSILHGVDIKREDSEIYVRARVEEEMLYLEVEDNGRGMTKEQMQQLLSESARKKTKGLSGIGVANIKERLELYYGARGSISFTSSTEGTKAVIMLPVSRNIEEYMV